PPLSRGYTLGSGEDNIELIKELMETYTKLFKRVLALEESKTAQDLVIIRLKLRVKKLEKGKKGKNSTTHEEEITSKPIPNIADEAVYEEWDDRVERAITTASSLDADQASGNINRTQSMTMPNVPLPQGIGAGGSPRCQEATRGSIAQTRSERVPTPSYDSPFLGVHTPRSDEERFEQHELTELDEEDPSKQGRSMIEEIDQDAGVTLVQIDADDQGRFDDEVQVTPTHVSAQGEAHSQEDQPKDQLGVLSAAKLVLLVHQCPLVLLVWFKKLTFLHQLQSNKAVRLQEELDEEERQRMARVHEAAQYFNKEEWENIRARVEVDEELAQRLQAKERNKYNEVDQAKMLIKKLFESTMKIVNTFVPIETKVSRRASELVAGSSQTTITDSAEVGSSKRAVEAELDYEGSKRQKTNEASGDDLVMLWSLVKELFSSTKPTDDKERTLWVELKRLFKPDTDDTLWKLHKVGIADNTGHNVVEHTQVGCRLPIVQQYKPPPCAQTLPGTYPSDMTVYTPSALSPLSVSPSYPSYHTNLA
nr:hypothetical protein [Tanacetum cinerariifolium]